MATENPVEMFDMYVAHVGINASAKEEAKEIAETFQSLMFLPVSETPKSYFAGTLVEVMNQNGRGTHGHIGFHVNDIDAAAKWFDDHGFKLNGESRALNADGSTRLIYFEQEIGGFAIHLTADK